MTEPTFAVTVHTSIAEIGEAAWQRCARGTQEEGERLIDPFTSYAFLHALEASGSVGERTGWLPRYLSVESDGQIIAVAPMYAKMHSQGEYVFDHSWAHAYENAGGAYYPKLQIAAPFTPVAGRRFLSAAGFEEVGIAALTEGAVQVAAQNGISSLHITFCTEAEARAGEEMGLMHRIGQQYHWENPDYESFDGFLAALSSRKRKTIRKERRVAQGFGGEIRQYQGAEITPEHWDAMWMFYQDTGARKWGTPYLTRAFFNEIGRTMRDDLLLVFAEIEGRPVAGALNVIGRDTLFGRYWGTTADFPCMHFEICYYQAIDFAITHGLRVEAGAQGEHKLARGYLPTPTHSLHWVADPGFRKAIAQYLVAEKAAVSEDIEVLTDYGPFRKGPAPEAE